MGTKEVYIYSTFYNCHVKVVTAQYFLWYFSLLPLILPNLNFGRKDFLLGGLLWGFAQVLSALFSFSFLPSDPSLTFPLGSPFFLFSSLLGPGPMLLLLIIYFRAPGCCLPTYWSSRGTTPSSSSGWRAWHSSVPTLASWPSELL